MGTLWRIVAAAGVAAGAIPILPAGAATASTGDEAQFVALINQLRASRDVGTLSVNGQLAAHARAWSVTMSSSGLHENPDQAWGAPSGWTALGENVGTGSSVGQIEQAFVDSPPHYANLIDPHFNQVGVGVVVSEGTLWVTEEFMAGPGGAAPRKASSGRAGVPIPARTPAPPPPPPGPAPIEPPPPVELVTVLGQLESFDIGR
jgi:hypothetical protein